jgi:hypothetical protein
MGASLLLFAFCAEVSAGPSPASLAWRGIGESSFASCMPSGAPAAIEQNDYVYMGIDSKELGRQPMNKK